MSDINFNSAISEISIDERESIPGLLADLCDNYGDCISVVCESNGSFEKHTSYELIADIMSVCAVMSSLPLVPSVAAIIGDNSYNWLVTYFACSCAGIAALTIDGKLSSDEIRNQLNTAETKFAFCDGKYIDKLNNLPEDFYIIALDNYKSYKITDNLSSYIKMGKSMLENGYPIHKCVDKRSSVITHIAFDSAAYCEDKAVTLSSRNVYEQALNASDALLHVERYCVTEDFSIPRSVISAISVIVMGLPIYIPSDSLYSRNNIFELLSSWEIDSITATPALLKKLYIEIWRNAENKELSENLKSMIKCGAIVSKIGIHTGIIINRIIKNELGLKLKNIVCFSNNIEPEVGFGLNRMGISLRCVYEASECGIITAMQKSNGVNDHLGKPLSGVLVKIGDAGQLLVRSDACMSGYLGEGKLPDYWLATGDYAEIIRGGYLVVANCSPDFITTEYAKHIMVSKLNQVIEKHLKNAKFFSVDEQNGGIKLNICFEDSFARMSTNLNMSAASMVEKINRELPEYKKITDIHIDNIS